MEKVCTLCGGKGHLAHECKIPLAEFDQWHNSLSDGMRAAMGPAYAVWNGWLACKWQASRAQPDIVICQECFKVHVAGTSKCDCCGHAIAAQPVSEAVSDEVEREWNETWRDIVAPNGTIDISQLKKELADYSMLLDAAGKVYMHVTGGKISKPSTLPEVVCSVADDYTTELSQERRDTAQPAGEAVAVKWWNGCDKTVPAALRYLADHERPSGGEQRFNSLHLLQLAEEIEDMAKQPLYTAPPAQVPVNQRLLDVAQAILAEDMIPLLPHEYVERVQLVIADAKNQPACVSNDYVAGIEAVAKMIDKKADDYAAEHGHDDMGSLSFGGGPRGEFRHDHHCGLIELAEEIRTLAAAQQPSQRPAQVPEIPHEAALILLQNSGMTVGNAEITIAALNELLANATS